MWWFDDWWLVVLYVSYNNILAVYQRHCLFSVVQSNSYIQCLDHSHIHTSFSAWQSENPAFCVKQEVAHPYMFTSRKHAYIILTPLKPHFYIVKLGFTGVYIIFLISAQNIDYGYSLEPPQRGGSN